MSLQESSRLLPGQYCTWNDANMAGQQNQEPWCAEVHLLQILGEWWLTCSSVSSSCNEGSNRGHLKFCNQKYVYLQGILWVIFETLKFIVAALSPNYSLFSWFYV